MDLKRGSSLVMISVCACLNDITCVDSFSTASLPIRLQHHCYLHSHCDIRACDIGKTHDNNTSIGIY